ncbi:MAG: 4-hydroxyphenylacetate isomerase, partial [Luminiphilus sp.]|nr:4-hydroxyphenylacetate isomerase [Luminiphilus sp.]
MTIRVVSFRQGEKSSWGVMTDDTGIIDLGARQGGSVLERLVSGQGISSLVELTAQSSPDLAVTDVELLPPVVCGP